MSGKWHVASSLTKPTDAWPMQRGFDAFFGTIIGAGSFYDPNTLTRGNENIEHEARAPGFFYTDAISDNAVAFIEQHCTASTPTSRSSSTSPTPRRTGRCTRTTTTSPGTRGRFDAGWDALRQERLDKLVASGHPSATHWKLTDRDPTQPPWTEAEKDEQFRAWTLRCMEVYAAQIDRMDQGIGRMLATLEKHGQLDDTLVIFLADNGACAEDIPRGRDDRRARRQAHDRAPHDARAASRCTSATTPGACPGPENTYQSYGTAWANLSNTPVPPLQALDPRGRHRDAADRALAERHRGPRTARCATRRATCPTSWRRSSTSTGATYPQTFDGQRRRAARGPVAAAGVRGDTTGDDRKPMFWEHEGNAAVRIGKWKLVQALPAAVGALRHGRGPHRAERPRVEAARAGARRWRRSTTRGRSAAACSTARRSWR